jgi:RNA polymerase sigma factor for flagellar operon FliA
MDALIEDHIGYAHAIAADLVSKYPSNVTRSDLKSAAEFGLVQAARAYDPTKGISFTTFAYYRIRGAILDEVRQLCRAARFEAVANEFMTEQVSNTSSKGELATHKELQGLTSQLMAQYLLSLDSAHLERVPDRTKSPADQVLSKESSDAVRWALAQLAERYRVVLQAYYYEELSLESIGRRMNLSKSWVSRIHGKALSSLREMLQRPHSSRGNLPKQPVTRSSTCEIASNSQPEHTITDWEHNGSYCQQVSDEFAAAI